MPVDDESLVARARRRGVSGLRTQAAAHGFQLAARFALVPYILARLPRDEYGLWAWMLTLSAFLVLAELGFAQGLVQPLAAALRARDSLRIGRLTAAAMSVPAAVVALVAIAVLALGAPRGSAASTVGPSAESLLLPLIASQGASLCSLPLMSLLSGLQRLDLAYALRLPMTVLQVVGTVIALESGGGAAALAWLQLGLALGQFAARFVACRRLLPGFALAQPTAADFVELRSVGLPMILLNLLWAMALGFERAFLGWISDLASFAEYAVASRLVLTVLEVQQIPGATLLQTSAALDAAGERRAVDRLYARSARLTAVIVGGMIGVLCVAGPPFLHAWAGGDFAGAGGLTGRLAVAFLLPGLCQPGIAVLAGAGSLGRLSRLFVVWSATCVLLDSLWLTLTGMAGAGVMLALINGVGTAVVVRRCETVERLPSALPKLAGAALVAALATAAGLAVRQGVDWVMPVGRIAALFTSGLCGAAFTAVYLTISTRTGLLDPSDRKLVADLVGRRLR